MKKYAKQYATTIIIVVVAMVCLTGFIINAFYSNLREKSLALGEARLYQEKEQMTSYMGRALDCVQMTSIQVEYMMENGADNEDLLSFLTAESARYSETIDENFTGIYGWFNGEYLDGIGWVPDADYVPTSRVWYTEAVAGNGNTVLVPPYVDAQTGNVMISICQLLEDGESVLSLDIRLDNLQQLAEQAALGGIGYGFVCDDSGLVVAHSNVEERGNDYHEKEVFTELIAHMNSDKSASFEIVLDGNRSTVFGVEILNGWYVVMVVTNDSLYEDLHTIILRSVLISLVVLIVVCVYMYAYIRREQKLVGKLYESREKLKTHSLSTLRALTRAIEAKDRYTKGHSSRVAKYSQMIAARMGKSEEEQDKIYNIALLHDVGKIRVPEEIINKAGKLTDEEFAFIQLHPVAGYNILKDIPGDEQLAIGAKFHHERFDGKGYPNGLAGENIPELARIIAVADAYDAMASNRSYRKALPREVVRSEIEKGIGTQFDPKLANIMIQIIDEDVNYELSEKEKSEKVILVVDDSKINMMIAENILKAESRYHILQATSGMEAIHIISENVVDLVLLDIEMPEMNGFETLEKIREISEVPVIFMTADKELSTINKATQMGVEDYITKPFSHPILLESVYSALYCLGEEG